MWQVVTMALRQTVLIFVVCGPLYALILTGVAQLLLPEQASGSLLRSEKGEVFGSRLIGQHFAHPAYFHGRPSVSQYDGKASGGSNLGPTSRVLREQVQARVSTYAGTGETQPLPVELVTTSASGLDPHLSIEGVRWQLARVAAARQRSPAQLEPVLASRLEGRTWGVLGEPRINVLALNVALDRLLGPPPRESEQKPEQPATGESEQKPEPAATEAPGQVLTPSPRPASVE